MNHIIKQTPEKRAVVMTPEELVEAMTPIDLATQYLSLLEEFEQVIVMLDKAIKASQLH